ncbi:Glycosyltransferase family 92 protein [Thalictrum thalictroides]|uniref:Glycosyltransferase family 92 protein n=1 Tax=Thalictrum thalictroides TaxID=46969 RepID=A0A7J6WI87_THATH|nr:Glycosyltransferase family 92 protein [Thalictrum thalictroides]
MPKGRAEEKLEMIRMEIQSAVASVYEIKWSPRSDDPSSLNFFQNAIRTTTEEKTADLCLFKPVLTLLQQSKTSQLVARSFKLNDLVSSEVVPLRVEDRVLFPDHVLLLVPKRSRVSWLNLHGGLDCIYRKKLPNSSAQVKGITVAVRPVLSVDEYSELQSIVRCPLPPSNNSALVDLRMSRVVKKNESLLLVDQRVHSWEILVYAAALDGKTVVVFSKGLNLRPDRVSNPAQFSCQFTWVESTKKGRYARTTNAITAAQEIVRCLLPFRLRKDPSRAHGIRVSIGIASHHGHREVLRERVQSKAAIRYPPIPSVAKITFPKFEEQGRSQYELCVCTMLWNQAPSLREWVMYHAWLGVERWFIYDNNSDDNIEKVIQELQEENYNVSRHAWPWIKSQEAGFSHCILKARNVCKWVAFMDVDEFFYFPFPTTRKTNGLGYPGGHSLQSLVTKLSSSGRIGEIRTTCHSFGPSGLISPPSQGVTMGYTCRLQSPERHKSIVRPDAVDDTLLNVVHHFHLKNGYRYLNLPQNMATINHYKYQVWEVFRSKFFRRVATYVTDWQENQNEGSKDRAPGLGTEAIEPPNWRLQFCEVWDTGLRDFVFANLADPISELLPWEKST